jgi:hypothetical protein
MSELAMLGSSIVNCQRGWIFFSRLTKGHVFAAVSRIGGIVPKRFLGEFAVFRGTGGGAGRFSRGIRGFSGGIVPARTANCSCFSFRRKVLLVLKKAFTQGVFGIQRFGPAGSSRRFLTFSRFEEARNGVFLGKDAVAGK